MEKSKKKKNCFGWDPPYSSHTHRSPFVLSFFLYSPQTRWNSALVFYVSCLVFVASVPYGFDFPLPRQIFDVPLGDVFQSMQVSRSVPCSFLSLFFLSFGLAITS
ncbi:hypothetical protein ABW19_dt0205237 [Dactylella cylindrospora]|nr:hypothetical protein ABW19_dt0205237 [Dactylella cylindrospora]